MNTVRPSALGMSHLLQDDRRTAPGPPQRPRHRRRCPGSGTPISVSALASLMAVCPPNWTTAPQGFSNSTTCLHVLGGERLEVESVGDVEVGGDGLRVVVDDDGLIAPSASAPTRSGRSSSRTRCPGQCGWGRSPEPAPSSCRCRLHDGLIFPVVGGIIVRRLGVELGGAGIHHLEGRHGCHISSAAL